ncbi:hypothetical protein ACOWPH_27730 [Anabaena sp. PCC 7938]|nr:MULTISPECIES: hypothetical protein [Anabaena]MCM2409201.1 hypothetical protein [Anabaena sp. CCAP 1446/1C]
MGHLLGIINVLDNNAISNEATVTVTVNNVTVEAIIQKGTTSTFGKFE